LVAAQVDNELSFFFRSGAYDLDYHPDAIALYRQFIGERYTEDTDGSLPLAYGIDIEKVEQLDPPRSFSATEASDLVVHLDWLRFKEWSLLQAIKRLAKPLREKLPELPLIHNFPGSLWGESLSVTDAESELSVAGYDLYPRGRDHQGVKELCQKLAGESRLPLIPELACGSWPWWFPQEDGEQLHNALSALMYGIKGFNLYMLANRDRWFGAPLSAEGYEEHPKYEEVRRLIQACKANGLHQLERKVEVAIVFPRDYYHLSVCTSLVDPLAPMALSLFQLGPPELCRDETFGLSSAIQIDAFDYAAQVKSSLDELGLPYHQLDSGVSSARLSAYKLLVVPTYDFMDSEFVERLDEFGKAGGCVLYGPQKPTRDQHLDAADFSLDGEFVADAVQLKSQLEHWAHRATRTFLPQGDVEVCCYEDESGPRVLFAANTSTSPQTVDLSKIFTQEKDWCCDALSAAPLDGNMLDVGGLEVRMVCCRKANDSDSDSDNGEAKK
jgi:beta-galactosidase